MSDCITVLIAALVIAALLGEHDGCGSNRRGRSRNCESSCGCNGD